MANETAVSVADPGVAGLLAAYDAAFAADRADEVAELFAEDARLQWPEEEDIVGRDAIRRAFTGFVDQFHTVSWEPSYQLAAVHGDQAFLLGRFVERRQVRTHRRGRARAGSPGPGLPARGRWRLAHHARHDQPLRRDDRRGGRMTGPATSVAVVQEALDRGDHQEVLRLTEALLAERPGDDAAHELRARALLALGRIDEAEQHAADAVRLDPDEIRYRELLAQVLATRGAHRDAAAEYGRLARNDPRQRDWLLAEAGERLDAAQAGRAAEAARAAVRLDPADAQAQLTLATTLARVGDGAGAMAAAASAERLLPGDPQAAEAVADAHWLLGQDAAAFARLAELAGRLEHRDRERVTAKARALYRRHAGPGGRLLAGISPLFGAALRRGWLHLA